MHDQSIGNELPHTIRFDRNIPGWTREQMRLRSAGQRLAIGLSIVSAVVAAYDGPEDILPTNMAVSTMNSWRWLALPALGTAVILWELSATSLRRQWRRDGRALRLESVSRAIHFANDTLTISRQGRPGSVWYEQAVAPLAALVYAASAQGNGKGMAWVGRMVARLADEGAEGWQAVADAVADVHDVLAARVNWWTHADPRQRDSVALVLNTAVNNYAGVHP